MNKTLILNCLACGKFVEGFDPYCNDSCYLKWYQSDKDESKEYLAWKNTREGKITRQAINQLLGL